MATLKEVPSGPHVLKLGKSFNNKNPTTSFHTIRYDYKPASAENTSESYLSFGDKKDVTIAVPKVDGEGDVKDVTVFRGSKKDCNEKECILLYDSKKGEFVLEQLSAHMAVKNTRKDASKQHLVEKIKKMKSKKTDTTVEEMEEEDDSDSSQSCSSSDESGDASDGEEKDEEEIKKLLQPQPPPKQVGQDGANLEEDLRLSESSDEG